MSLLETVESGVLPHDLQINELFHSGVSLNCKIYIFVDPVTKERFEHYWITKGSSLEIYNSQKVLVRSVDIFPDRDLKIKISGLRLIQDEDKVIVWGRDSFILLDVKCDIYGINILKLENLSLDNYKNQFSFDSLVTEKGNANIIFNKSIANLKERTYTARSWITAAEYRRNTVYLLTSSNEVFAWNDSSQTLEKISELENIKSISYKGTLAMRDEQLVIISPTITAGCYIWTIDIANLNACNIVYRLSEDCHTGIIFDSQVDDEFKYLVTCSDDRSINLYDFETGHLITKLYGHKARVWCVKFVYNDAQNLFGIISCSEDCKFILWKFNDDHSSLQRYETHEVTQIKNCWSLDYKNDKVLTCGNDGRVKLTNVLVNKIDPNIISLELDLPKKETLKGLIKCNDIFFGISNAGSIICFTKFGKICSSIFADLELPAMAELVTVNDKYFIAFDKKNIVYFFSQDRGNSKLLFQFEIKEVARILSLHIISEDDKFIRFLVDSPNRKDSFAVFLVDLTLKKCQCESLYPKIQTNLKLPVTVTSAIFSVKENFLMVGTLNGKILFFKNGSPNNFKCISFDSNNEPIVTIKSTGETYKSKDMYLVTSKSHYSIMTEELSVLTNNSSIKIEAADYNSVDGVILFGIKDNYYIEQLEGKNFIRAQYDLKQYKQLFKNHRGWVGSIAAKSDTVHALTVKLFDSPLFNDCLIHEGTHGREIRSVTCVNYNKPCGIADFVTGSEDTTIKHYTVLLEEGEKNKETTDSLNSTSCAEKRLFYEPIIPHQQMTYRAHVSGIQTTAMIECNRELNNNKYLVSTSAKEELFIWKLFISDQGSSTLAIVGKLPTTKDLYNKDITAELRITCFEYDINSNILFTCYSNSMIRSWKISLLEEEKLKFSLVQEIFYKNCAIFDCSIADGLFVIGASDGNLTSYVIDQNVGLFFNDSISIHQSGVLTVATLGCRKIVSGGDDNTIALTEIDGNKKFVFKSKIINAANSAVTCIKSLNAHQFAAVSTDQIFSIGDIDKFSSAPIHQFDQELLNQQYTHVADTQSIDVFDKFCLIGGLGLSLLEIPRYSDC